MENKKDNALEKAENITENTSKRTSQKSKKNMQSGTQKTKQNNVKNSNISKKVKSKANEKNQKVLDKKQLKEQRRAEKIKQKQDRKIERERIKAQREKDLAEQRLERARLKAHKKAEKQKAKATALREKNRRKAEAKEKKQLLKEQRIARREMLKNESKKDRQKRIAEERQAKRVEKQKIREQRAEKRKQKLEHKRQMREQKQKAREQKRKDRQRAREKNRGYGGWLAAVISLGLATLILASVLTFTFLLPSTNDTMLETSYQRAFLDTVEQVENIDLNLSKVLATKDNGAIQKYLVNTAINSELAENDLQELPLNDEYKFYTAKVINQIGDFSKYLVNKIIDGEKITEKDREDLSTLYKANLTLKNALADMLDNMGNDYSFSSLSENQKGDAVLSRMTELENLSVTYPELIYDGPFSDGQVNKEIKGLPDNQVSKQEAIEIFTKTFEDYSFSKVECTGESQGNLECYNLEGMVDDNLLFAQISKNGGKLIMFSYAGDCQDVQIDSDKAIFNGLEFLQGLGIDDMQEVWFNLSDGVYTINYVYKTDSVIVYPDMIKVRVCAETGKVIGLEAKTYYTNHTSRNMPNPLLTKSQAEQRVFDQFNIESARLVLVPYNQNSERLCYEFSGNYNDDTFYVYIDALTGSQVQIFKVVSGSEGTLLM